MICHPSRNIIFSSLYREPSIQAMSEDVPSVKTRLLKLFQDLDEVELEEIKEWITTQSYKKDLNSMRALSKTESTLQKIGNALKKMVPLDGELPTENIISPTVGDQNDSNKINTCHVDGFLYDNEELEELLKEGKLKKYYCFDCHSRNIKELIFISHSISKLSLQFMFKVLLPSDLEGKQLLDIGSRLGTVLYSAYYFSNASQITGVEINKEFCNIQNNIIKQFSVDENRLKIIHSDILECQDIIANSDILVLNALDYFVETEKHCEIWKFFKKSFKKGSYLIATRSIPKLLDSLKLSEELSDWLTVCRPCQMENEILFDIEDLLEIELFLYVVN